MQLTPEQIQGVLELEPRAQVDRLKLDKPYIRIGYWGQIRDLDKLQVGLAKLGLKATEIDDYDEDTGWGYWYELTPIQGTINEEMSSGDYIKFLMDKFYEYRMLAADPSLDNKASKLYLDKASEYYERAQEEIDKTAPDMTDHLSDEDKALPNVPLSARDQAMVDDYEEEEANREVPRDYASMYENKNKNKMNDINLNRWAKLAGINENEGGVKGNEEWEGSINQLKKDADNPAGFAEMADIILSKYPDEGPSTYRMEVYHNNDNVVTGASGGFAIDNGNVYFDFKFKDGKVVDYSFDEQNY